MPTYKRQGIGKILACETIKHLSQVTPIHVTVCTRKINIPAIEFYKKLGFQEISVQKVHAQLPEYKYQGFALTLDK